MPWIQCAFPYCLGPLTRELRSELHGPTEPSCMFVTRRKRKFAALEAFEFRCACMPMKFSQNSAARKEQPTLAANSACEVLHKPLYRDRGVTLVLLCRIKLSRTLQVVRRFRGECDGCRQAWGSKGPSNHEGRQLQLLAILDVTTKSMQRTTEAIGESIAISNRSTSSAPSNSICLL
jgi:hypothetical protein